MVTKLASSYFTGAEAVSAPKNVKGFRSGILTVVVGEGSNFSMGAYMTTDGTTTPSSESPRAYFYIGGVKQTGNVTLNEAGVYTLVIDFDGATNLKINIVGSYANSQLGLCLKQETYSNVVSYIDNSIKDVIKAVEESREDAVLVAYNWGDWIDVLEWNSARLFITGIGKIAQLACTSNPCNPRVDALDTNIPLYDGLIQVSSLPSNMSESRFQIDLKDSASVKIDKTQSGAQSGAAYLILSKNELKKEALTVDRQNAYMYIGTNGVHSLNVEITIDGITEGSDNAQVNITDSDNATVKFICEDAEILGSMLLTAAGTYKLHVDCKDRHMVQIAVRRATGYTIHAVPSTEDVDYSRVDEELMTFNRARYYEGVKQLEIEAVGAKAGDRIYIEGSNDNFATISEINFLNLTTNTNLGAYINFPEGNTLLFCNVEDYKKVRVRYYKSGAYSYNELSARIKIKAYSDYKEGLTLPYWGTKQKNYINGYKYLKLSFKESMIVNGETMAMSVKGCSPFFSLYNSSRQIVGVYNRDMNPIPSIEYGGDAITSLFGTPSGDGYIVELDAPYSGNLTYPRFLAAHQQQGYECNIAFDVTCYTQKPEPETCLTKVYEKADYDVYQLPNNREKRDVLNYDVLEWEDNMLYFYRGGYLGTLYKIPFGADNVKNYVEGETIQFAYLLPFGGSRKRSGAVGNLYNPSRIVVFTQSRVYHNFPYRGSDGAANCPISDAQLFDESSIIIPQKTLQPVNDKSKVVTRKRYFPVLADYDYDQFNGRVAGTDGFVDTYGNGGLVKWSESSPRNWLDIPMRGITYWGRLEYSNMAKGTKWCVFGNYNGIPGTEPVLMATNDGGRTWFVKLYFACTDFYNSHYGSRITLAPITDVAGEYVPGSLKMCRRRYNVPTASNKEPATPFVINEAEQTLVTSFTVDSAGDTIVTLAEDVAYYDDGVVPVVFFKNVNANSEWNYICNTNLTADASTNNGIFFRVLKVSANTYKLKADIGYNYLYNNEAPMVKFPVCRHIHAVNDSPSGFLISTGESYKEGYFEGGFIYHLKQNFRNGDNAVTTAPSSAGEGRVTRLCSTWEGVNRACGAYLFMDNGDPTLLYVSDESGSFADDTEHRYASIDGRTEKVPVSPFGVFVGKLSEIDEQRKFKCVAELPVTSTGLLQTHGHFAAQGHQNVIMLSKDGFHWEIDVENGSHINGFDNYGNIYFGNKVAVFK